MERKKKLLMVVDWFAPGYKAGGPIKSSLNLAYALKSNYQVNILTTDTDHGETEPYEGIVSNKWTMDLDPDISVYYAEKKHLTRRQLKAQIKDAGADIIYLNHIWSPYFVLYPLWLKVTGQVKSKVVICPRGGLYDSALSVKRFKKTPVLRLMKWLNIQRHVVFHATNTREKEAIERFFPKSSVVIADNLPSSKQPALSLIEKKPGDLKCIFIARIVGIKNLLFLLECLANVTANVNLTVIGPNEDVEYWNNCKRKIEQLPTNIKVDYRGPIPNEQLLSIVKEHHLFVLPTTGENFGHSIFEALLAGRPVLISDQTPWLGLAHKQIGWDLPLANPGAFTRAMEEAANWDQRQFDEMAANSWQFAKSYIENSAVKQQYLQLFS
jgi:glycosyltransferase involved in cell wall biosynthesis